MSTTALPALGGVVKNTPAAWEYAKRATANLDGHRKREARELVAILSDVLGYVERLEANVCDDVRAKQ